MEKQLPDHIRAHERSNQHREEVLGSALCGCFHCLATFPPERVREWVDEDDADVGQTALCPECGLDTVLGSGSGFPLTEDFLRQMQAYWCADADSDEDDASDDD
ncbi:hypothetical protein ACLESO_29735 [Pyxidicoccus sp. 3LG]